MSKAITYIITFLIVFGLLPYVGYNVYFNHQDDIYKTMKEYDSYTTLDKNYSIDVMQYQSVHGEEVYTFKVYLVDHTDHDKPYFLKTVTISSDNTEITYDDTVTKDGVIKTMITGGDETKMVQVDCKTKTPPGKKLRLGII